MTEVVQAVIVDKLSDRGQIVIIFAGRRLPLAGEALKTHTGIGKGDAVHLTIEKDDKGVAHIVGIKRIEETPAASTPKATTAPPLASTPKPVYQAPIIDGDKNVPLSSAPAIASAQSGASNAEAPSVLSTGTNPQVIIHKHEGQESRPDSIEFSGTSKKAGLKIYFDASNPEESLERIEQAFLLYDHSVREMQKRQEGVA